MTEGPQQPDAAARRVRLLAVLPWFVVGVVMVVLAAVAVVRLFVADPDQPDEATSVRQVAELTETVAEELDVPAGLDLLCDEPIELYRMAVEATIVRWQALTGSPAPEIDAKVSEVDDGATGSFLLRISSDDPALEDERRTFQVFVEQRDGRSCVVGIGGRQADEPTVRFADDGYSGVTSPTPTPRR